MTASPAASVVFSSAFASALAMSLLVEASTLASLSAALASLWAAESVAFATSSCTLAGGSAWLQADSPSIATTVRVRSVPARIVFSRLVVSTEGCSKTGTRRAREKSVFDEPDPDQGCNRDDNQKAVDDQQQRKRQTFDIRRRRQNARGRLAPDSGYETESAENHEPRAG